MTAAAPDISLRRLARKPALPPVAPSAESGDRIFMTLLSLNFMLLAFFVVLGTAASIDTPHAASVAKSVRVIFAPSGDEITDISPIRLTARQALQAGVAEAFADILPIARRHTGDNGDRVDLTVPASELALKGPHARDTMLDGIAALLRSAPAGLRYQLVLDGPPESAVLAEALMARGVTARQLMIGASLDANTLQFSFLLLEGDDDDVFTRLMSREAP